VTTFAPVRASFRKLAVTIVPEAEALDDRGWEELEQIIERGLASRPDSIRRQLRILVRARNVLPLVRFGKTFSALDASKRTAFLEGVQNAPLLLLRRGFWGLRTLVFMGYYARDDARNAIGYRADPRGWTVRR
jgi:hypothetical protein